MDKERASKERWGGCMKDKCVFVCMCVHMGAGVDQQDGRSHVEREENKGESLKPFFSLSQFYRFLIWV